MLRFAWLIALPLMVAAQPKKEQFTPALLALTVSNINTVSTWYTTHLGFTVIERLNFPEYDSMSIFILERDGFRLELIHKRGVFSIKRHVPAYDAFDASLTGLNKIAFNITNIQNWHNRLQKAG